MVLAEAAGVLFGRTGSISFFIDLANIYGTKTVLVM